MNDIGRHFRLESELKGVLLAVAAVVMVSGAYMTLVTQSTGSHPLITDSAGIATTFRSVRVTRNYNDNLCSYTYSSMTTQQAFAASRAAFGISHTA